MPTVCTYRETLRLSIGLLVINADLIIIIPYMPTRVGACMAMI